MSAAERCGCYDRKAPGHKCLISSATLSPEERAERAWGEHRKGKLAPTRDEAFKAGYLARDKEKP